MKHNPKNTLKLGFSLIEMLVVLAVLGVIAAIAIPNIAGIKQEPTGKISYEMVSEAARKNEAIRLAKELSGTWNLLSGGGKIEPNNYATVLEKVNHLLRNPDLGIREPVITTLNNPDKLRAVVDQLETNDKGYMMVKSP